MSRHQMNKVIRELSHNLSARTDFMDDRAAYLRERDLDEHESTALLGLDFEALFLLGAHPFLLWALVRDVLPSSDPGYTEYYVSTIGRHGHVDYET